MTASDSNVNVGDKRKATTTNSETTNSNSNTKSETEEEGGKDLVEKKQTTLDDIVHSEQDRQPAESKSEDKEVERPAKKTKTEESSAELKNKDEVKEREEKVKEREEKVKEKEEKVDKDVEMKSSPSKSKSTIESDKSTTSTSNPEPEVENITTESQAPKSDQSPVQTPPTTSKPAGNGTEEETVPGDEAHLDHPENWTTGGDPATEKQKGFLKVLEKQKGVPVGDLGGIGKSEASEKIDELKNMCKYIHRLERL